MDKLLDLLDIHLEEWNFYHALFFCFSEIVDAQLGYTSSSPNTRYQFKQLCTRLKIPTTCDIQRILDLYLEQPYKEMVLHQGCFMRDIETTILENPYTGRFQHIDYSCIFLTTSLVNPKDFIVHNGVVLYCGGNLIGGKHKEPIPALDYSNLRALSQRYLSDGKTVLAIVKQPKKHDLGVLAVALRKVDVASFQVKSLDYACDKHAIYYQNKKTNAVNAIHLRVISKTIKINLNTETKTIPSDYAHDGNFIYYKGKILCDFKQDFHQLDEDGHYFGNEKLSYFHGKLCL